MRLFHWLLIAAVAANLYLFDAPSWLLAHMLVGHAILALTLWRIAYGFVGRHEPSRFSAFVDGPRAACAQLGDIARGRATRRSGHTPLGGWMIVAFVAMLLGLALTGLVALIGEQRLALTGLGMGFDAGALAASLHRLGADALPVLIAVHIAGAAVAWLQRSRPIVVGAASSRPPSRAAAVTWTAVALTVVGILTSGVQIARRAAALPLHERFDTMPLFAESCGDCHDLFHPVVLPPAAWRTLMDGLGDHFGEDAALEDDDARALSRFLASASRESADMKVALGIAALDGEDANLAGAVTGTRYWMVAHENVDANQFARPDVASASHCGACHLDATTGRFDRHRIRSPGAP